MNMRANETSLVPDIELTGLMRILPAAARPYASLARFDRPQLVALRRALARDIDRLKSVPYVDVAGIAVKLDQVIAAID